MFGIIIDTGDFVHRRLGPVGMHRLEKRIARRKLLREVHPRHRALGDGGLEVLDETVGLDVVDHALHDHIQRNAEDGEADEERRQAGDERGGQLFLLFPLGRLGDVVGAHRLQRADKAAFFTLAGRELLRIQHTRFLAGKHLAERLRGGICFFVRLNGQQAHLLLFCTL